MSKKYVEVRCPHCGCINSAYLEEYVERVTRCEVEEGGCGGVYAAVYEMVPEVSVAALGDLQWIEGRPPARTDDPVREGVRSG